MNRKIRILLADDHLVVRMGLAALIGLEKDMALVGEAADGAEAVRLFGTLRPDLVIMDLVMPRLNGVAATAEIRKAEPDAKILILTSFGTSDEILRALDAGAVGAIVKDSAKGELIDAIRAVARGQPTLSPALRRQMAGAPSRPVISDRQRDILQYISKGLNNGEIADILGVGRDCVKSHLRAAFERLGVTTRAEAVATAISFDLIQP